MDEHLDRLVPLTPAVFHILLALAAGERHGYALLQEIAASTDGHLRLGPGTLYRSIKQLLGLGLIEESDSRPIRPWTTSAAYYRLTARGRRVAQLEALRLARLVREAEARQLLGGFGETGLGGIRRLEAGR